ncbi:MAG: hypothetical protein Tsb0014_26260 [Pleurocapsa sp.]
MNIQSGSFKLFILIPYIYSSTCEIPAESPQFKNKFCDLYGRTGGVVDLAELVATILFPANPPIVIGGLVTIKLARIAINNYCAGR